MRKIKLKDRVINSIINCEPFDFGNLNVNKIASNLNVSVSHLSRDFKENMKISLHEYILREKIKRACFILKQNHRLTVKEIAQNMDCCSCSYFIKVFKKYVGITPAKFRELDNGFYGLHDRRKRPVHRRSGTRDRRSGSGYGEINIVQSIDITIQFPDLKECRTEQPDRRRGPKDRRQLYIS